MQGYRDKEVEITQLTCSYAKTVFHLISGSDFFLDLLSKSFLLSLSVKEKNNSVSSSRVHQTCGMNPGTL